MDETVITYKDLAPGTHGVGVDSGYNFPSEQTQHKPPTPTPFRTLASQVVMLHRPQLN